MAEEQVTKGDGGSSGALSEVVVGDGRLSMEWDWDSESIVVNLVGRIDGGNATEFKKQSDILVVGGSRVLVLDLERLGYISSAGLRTLVLTFKKMESQGRKFGVFGFFGTVAEVFMTGGFDRIVPTFKNREEAVLSMTG